MKYEPIPKFNDHGASCKGHANWMLDCTYENQDDRDVLIKALDNAIISNENDIKRTNTRS